MTTSGGSGPLKSEQLTEEFYEQNDRFFRWRFLQDVLEGDADVDVVNQVLHQVLDGALKYPRPDGNSGREVVPLPAKVQGIIENLLSDKNIVVDGRVVALREDYDDVHVIEPTTETLRRLEELLPTQDDDEDAVKSLWDTVMELYGREAVKYQETKSSTLEWKITNTVSRLLIHFDFLTLGIVRKPLK
jgi:hypothetical protein